MTAKKKPGSYLVNGALASVVLYFVLDVSQSESRRTTIDYAVIVLVCGAIL